MDEINESLLWAQGSRFYEQLKVVDDMNNSWSYELKPLDAMNNLGLRVEMNDSRSWAKGSSVRIEP